MKQIHIAWIGFQRRQLSMQRFFGFSVHFFPIQRRIPRVKKALAYLKAGMETWRLLHAEKPEVVWVQVPQTPLLWVALLYRFLSSRTIRVVADCHNAMFRAPWNRLPFTRQVLNACDLVVVHNDSVVEQAIRDGVSESLVVVVEDPPADFSRVESPSCSLPRPWVLFPASFAADEPIAELFEAARLLPDVSFLVTGNVRNLRQEELLLNKPVNLHLLGFVPNHEFDGLVMKADAVLALTIHDGIQLSVCGEAVGAGRPLVVSDTTLLRRLYPVGSVFVKPTAVALAQGVTEILGRGDVAAQEMISFRTKTEQDYRDLRVPVVVSRLSVGNTDEVVARV